MSGVSIRAGRPTAWTVVIKRPNAGLDMTTIVSASLIVRRPDQSLVTLAFTVLDTVPAGVTQVTQAEIDSGAACILQRTFVPGDLTVRGSYVGEPNLTDNTGGVVQAAPVSLPVTDI